MVTEKGGEKIMYEEKLKPCLFCGGIAHIAVYYPETEREFHVVK